jgi:hypothetical protein
MYLVLEQQFHDTGYDWALVATRPTAQIALKEKHILEQRFREDEVACREDWDNRETRGYRLQSKLQHLGNRYKTRLFAVRKADGQ